MSPFRQNATATHSVALPRNGDSSQSAGAGAYRLGFAPTRSTRSGRRDESFEPMEHQLACPLLGQVQCFASTGPRNGGGRRATFQRFAAMWLRHAASGCSAPSSARDISNVPRDGEMSSLVTTFGGRPEPTAERPTDRFGAVSASLRDSPDCVLLLRGSH